MVIENAVLEYLKKQGQTNTFRLARELGIDRYKILNIIKNLEENQLVEFKFGIVKFLKFPIEKKKVVKKPIKIKKAPSKPKRKARIKKRLEIKNIENKIREQAEYIKRIEKTIKELQQKANLPPKIIRKTIIKKVPIKVKEAAIKQKEKEIKPQRFKIPKFDISWIKNIQQIDIPKFIGRKINIGKPRINFAELNKNIQQLHIPEMFKKGG